MYRLTVNIRVSISKKVICNSLKLKLPLGNTGIFGKEVGNMLIKIKRDIEGNNSGQYLFIPTTPNKEIPFIFILTTHKEYLMHILYRSIICKSEIYYRKHM